MQDEDLKLVNSAKNGDRDAFGRLLEKHYNLMFRVAYRFLGKREDAEEVAQTVCIGLAEKIRSFRGESLFTTWLYRVVVNCCRDQQRRSATAKRLDQSYLELSESAKLDEKDSSEKAGWLYRAISKLEDSLRETALLVLAEELSHAEAGGVLGCAESTISWRMHEVRKHLKTILGSENE